MHINKLLLAHALGLALTAAAPEPVKPRVDAGDDDPKPEPPVLHAVRLPPPERNAAEPRTDDESTTQGCEAREAQPLFAS